MNDELKKSQTFSFGNYTDKFDTHIATSIRVYADLRDDVVGIRKYFVESGTQVLDIGCSEGTLIERMLRENEHAEKQEELRDCSQIKMEVSRNRKN